MDPAGHYLYATLNQAGEVVKVDLGDDQVVGRVAVGEEPRSLAIATDGLTLYVVDYDDDNVKSLRAADLATLQTIPTGVHPIGVTYDDTTGDCGWRCTPGTSWCCRARHRLTGTKRARRLATGPSRVSRRRSTVGGVRPLVDPRPGFAVVDVETTGSTRRRSAS